MFAGTPPLEALKLLIAVCAASQEGGEKMRLATIDIKRAYFYAPVKREVFVEIPDEDKEPGDEDKVGMLALSLYGTRDAAQNWAAEYSGHLKRLGFTQGLASPCNFHHQQRKLKVTCHGDDFLVAGELVDIQWLIKAMEGRYEMKSSILGPEEGCVKEVKILNRCIRWTSKGLEYEADPRHAKAIIEALGLQGANPLSIPGAVNEEQEKDKDSSSESTKMGDKEFRAIAARLNYLSMDRPDLQYISRCISRSMCAPTAKAIKMLKRVGRYLVGAPRMVQLFPWSKKKEGIVTYGDSNWAGDKDSAKSTSGGAMHWDGHCIKTWSSTQQVIALSSGEAELYATTKAASETVGMISILKDFGMETTAVVLCDSSAAIGICSRQGVGRVRHVNVRYLWMQQRLAEKEFELKKVDGKRNVADLMTKNLPKADLDKFMTAMKMSTTSSLKVAQVRRKRRQ